MRHHSTTAAHELSRTDNCHPRTRLQDNTTSNIGSRCSCCLSNTSVWQCSTKIHHRVLLLTWGRYGVPPYMHVVLRDGAVSSKSAATWVATQKKMHTRTLNDHQSMTQSNNHSHCIAVPWLFRWVLIARLTFTHHDPTMPVTATVIVAGKEAGEAKPNQRHRTRESRAVQDR